MKKKVDVLELKNKALKKKISEYKYESRDNWNEFKQEFNHDLNALGNELTNILAKKD
jgi:hypothetical protein